MFLCVSLQIFYFTKHSGKFYTCLVLQAKTNTWSHQRRKRRQEARKRHSESDNACEQEEANKMSENMGMDAESESKEMNKESEDKSVKNIVSEEISNTKCSENEEERDIVNKELDEKVNPKAINEKGEGGQDKSRKRSHDQSDGCEGGSEVKRVKQEDGSQAQTEEGTLPKMRSRQEIIEQFHKEQTENDGAGKKKKPLSFYEKLEPFSESEECLLLCKFVLKKEEGKMNLTLTHLGGDKNAMYQIMQYFRNKLAVPT